MQPKGKFNLSLKVVAEAIANAAENRDSAVRLISLNETAAYSLKHHSWIKKVHRTQLNISKTLQTLKKINW